VLAVSRATGTARAAGWCVGLSPALQPSIWLYLQAFGLAGGAAGLGAGSTSISPISLNAPYRMLRVFPWVHSPSPCGRVYRRCIVPVRRELGRAIRRTKDQGHHINSSRGRQVFPPVTPVVGGWAGGQKRTGVRFVSPVFFVVFLKSPRRETPKNAITKIREKNLTANRIELRTWPSCDKTRVRELGPPSPPATKPGGCHQCVVGVRERSAAEAGSARPLLAK
jgi:hypothetical protein